jgi:hypothetical protein
MAYSTAEFHRQRMVETRDAIAQQLRDLADRVEREKPREADGENSAHVYIQFASSIENEIRNGLFNLGLHRLWTSAATLSYTETSDALQRLDSCQLRYIEATNPGIDMDEVRRRRGQLSG